MRTICPDHAFSRGSVWSLGFHIPSGGPRRGTGTCSYGEQGHGLIQLFLFFEARVDEEQATTCPSNSRHQAKQEADQKKKKKRGHNVKSRIGVHVSISKGEKGQKERVVGCLSPLAL